MVAFFIDRNRQPLPVNYPWPADRPALEDMRRFTAEIEARFKALEDQRFGVNETIQTLTEVGLQRIDEVVGPVLEEVLRRLRTASDIFEATSSSEHAYTDAHIDGQTLVFDIDEGKRNSFTTQGFVRIVPTASPELAILAEVESYDWETGDLTVTVFSYSTVPVGDPVSFAAWNIFPALAEGIQNTVEGGGLAEAIDVLTTAVAGKVSSSLLGALSGVATLDGSGKLAEAQRFSVPGGGDLTSVAGVAGVSGDVPTASLYSALGIAAAIASAVTSLVPNTRQVNSSGLLTGGGPLSGSLSLVVAKALAADFANPAEEGKALTPKTVWDAAAPQAQTYAETLNINLALGRFNHTVALVTGPMAIVLSGLVPGMNGWIKATADGSARVIAVQTGSVAAAVHGMTARQWTIPSGETWKFHYSVEVGGGSPVINWGVEKAIG